MAVDHKKSVIRNNGPLPRAPLGSSDMLVTRVCAGTMTWGSFCANEVEAHHQLDELHRMGVNFFDTAEIYPAAFNNGKTTEEWIGNWMEKKIKSGELHRDEIYIATKVNPCGDGSKGRSEAHSYDSDTVLLSCSASLKRMKIENVDLYYLHWPCRNIPVFGPISYQDMKSKRSVPPCAHSGELDTYDDQVRAIKGLFDRKLIRNWALSNENAHGITMFCLACDRLGVPRPVCVQNDFSLNLRNYEADTLEAATRFGVVGLPYGCLSGGTLTGKYLKGSKWEEKASKDRPMALARHNSQSGFQPRYAYPMAAKAAEKYAQIAERHGVTPTELALAWANQRWYNGGVIIGTTTVEQVRECVGAFKITLGDDILEEVDVIHEEFRNPSGVLTTAENGSTAVWLQR
eukprot:GHVN01099597.1.p1 GENE.GHVN01099597.1~~GHVN01099597.1.p1  ORF type:complete len:402 (-),score=34.39 GHVN01099597.1:91-1296(-)